MIHNEREIFCHAGTERFGCLTNHILAVIWLLQVSGEEHIYFRPIIWGNDEYSISCNICISDTICLGGFPNGIVRYRHVSAKAIGLNFSRNCAWVAFNWVLSVLCCKCIGRVCVEDLINKMHCQMLYRLCCFEVSVGEVLLYCKQKEKRTQR